MLTSFTNKIWVISDYPAYSGRAASSRGIAARLGQAFKMTPVFYRSQELRRPVYNFINHAMKIISHLSDNELKDALDENNLTRETLYQKLGAMFFLQQLARKKNVPRLVLTDLRVTTQDTLHTLHEQTPFQLQFPKACFVVGDLNIDTFARYGNLTHDQLVPHNLSVKGLQKAAQKHADRMPKGDGPLVAIAVAMPQRHTVEEFISCAFEKLTECPEQPRIALVSSPRTERDLFRHLANALTERVQSSRVLLFDFAESRQRLTKNPYRALLTLADHFIVLGESHSMVSDRLTAGRTAHIFYDAEQAGRQDDYGRVMREGKVRNFRHTPDLKTAQFPSINATADIAADIAADYLEHAETISDDAYARLSPQDVTDTSSLRILQHKGRQARQAQKKLVPFSAR